MAINPITVAVQALYEKYVDNEGSYQSKEEVEIALNSLNSLSGYFPIGNLIIKNSKENDAFWLEEI